VTAAKAPSRQQGYYARLRRLRSVMEPDGWLSVPAEQLGRAMGTEVGKRTREDTLAFALGAGVLRREVRGGRNHKAVYRATLPDGIAAPKTTAVERWDTSTGEQLPNGRRRVPECPVSAHTETGSLRTPECAPLVLGNQRNPVAASPTREDSTPDIRGLAAAPRTPRSVDCVDHERDKINPETHTPSSLSSSACDDGTAAAAHDGP